MSRFRRLIPPVAAFLIALPAVGDPLPPDASYRPLPTQPLATVRAEDEAAKPEVMRSAAVVRAALRPFGPADPGRDDVGRAQAGAGRRAGQAAGRA